MYIVDHTSDFFKDKVSDVNIAVMPIGSVEAHGHEGEDETSAILYYKGRKILC